MIGVCGISTTVIAMAVILIEFSIEVILQFPSDCRPPLGLQASAAGEHRCRRLPEKALACSRTCCSNSYVWPAAKPPPDRPALFQTHRRDHEALPPRLRFVATTVAAW